MSDEKWIEDPPEGVEGWRNVWRENLRYRVAGPPAFFRDTFRNLVRKLVNFGRLGEEERQRNFNVATLEMISDLRTEIASFQASVREINEQRLPLAVQRNDALVAALDQKVEMISARLLDLSLPLLTQTDVAQSPSFREDFIYRRVEEKLRGSETQVAKDLDAIVGYGRKSSPLVDAGCGRGELLAACKAAGVGARGFDMNERSVAALKDKGLHAEIGAIPSCFANLPDASVGTIVASHVVEHLPVHDLISLYAEAARVLRPGGFLVIETPNAESMRVSAGDFWRDPTHIAPRHAAALTLIGREFAFAVEDLRTLHPHPEASAMTVGETDPPEVRRVLDRVNALLFGDQDLRIVFRK